MPPSSAQFPHTPTPDRDAPDEMLEDLLLSDAELDADGLLASSTQLVPPEETFSHTQLHDVSDRPSALSNRLATATDITQAPDSQILGAAIVQSALDPMFAIDAKGIAIVINPSAERIFGYARREVLGKDIIESVFVHPWQRLLRAHMARHTGTEAGFQVGKRFEAQARRADGSLFPVELSISRIPIQEGPYFSVIARDITSRKTAEEALRESEERYALAVRGANDALWDWSLKTDVIYFSPRFQSMLGCEDIEIGSDPNAWFDRVHPEDLPQLKADLNAHLQGETTHLKNEHRLCHDDSSYRWVLCRGIAVRDSRNRASRLAGSFTDITARKLIDEQLYRAALHDDLTGLPNRTLFVDRLERMMQMARRNPSHVFGVLFLDFDRFKVINDSLGHAIGDRLLVGVARRIENCLRACDSVARLGGDEFVILLSQIKDIEEAALVAERIQSALMLPFRLNGHEVFITASIGIVSSDAGYESPEEILRDADTAMYQAKHRGKAQYVFFNRDMHASAMARLRSENDMRRAIKNQEFYLNYQPIVLPSGDILGFEALVRWQHPERGFVSPGEFIPIAEETGLILPLGEWVLREACQQMRQWQQEFPSAEPLYISVNITSNQISQANFIETVEHTLRETGLAASSLRLEITESLIMENLESTSRKLQILRELGVQVYIDDFGTGYSSFSYLQNLPIDALKIDKMFIDPVSEDPKSHQIVRAIITLAEGLGLRVVAEGVETDEQLKTLEEMGCDAIQGYLMSRPLPTSDAGELIERSPASTR
ncbi:MAG: EAL domain-containing protein [Cyanobacteria bacterium P01_F01_bin.33]